MRMHGYGAAAAGIAFAFTSTAFAQEPVKIGFVTELTGPWAFFGTSCVAGLKLADYFRIPSLRHYLIVDTDSQVVIHHRRDEEGRIEVRIVHDGPLTLDPPGLAIDVRDIFAGL